MKKRRLGATGYEVSEIGYGAWGLGADMWRGVDDAEGRKALREAIDQGITFIDTALAYGNGHSERVIGDELRDDIRAGRAVIATKIPPKNSRWPARAEYRFTDVFPAKYIKDCTERSLKNLRMDALHVQQLHVWNDVWLQDPAWQESLKQIVKLKEEGKVLHWGISINDHAPETALKALTDPIFETAQVIYNIYDRSPEKALFALAKQKPLGIIVRVPFDEGALTGQIKADTVFPPGDWRAGYFAGDRKAEAERRAQALSALLDGEAQSLPELALRFILSAPEVSTVIPGMRRPAHVRQNAATSAKGPLSPQLLAKLKSHAWDKNWYPDD
ncbi:MAG TPA: aldo/keto reductase [Gemmatimonadales bacterium]|jgi:aryl-alcohol dehydrogenase-like predicted oxidoreductase|nr:aldo/keto reductase [Gemmatimonadales bacterium]